MRRHLVVVAVLLLTACGGERRDASTRAVSCESPRTAASSDLVPPELQLDQHATVTKVERKGAALGVTAVSDLPIVELYPPLARAILDAGYSIVSSDNEGFEAEIFFGDDKTTGAYRLREAACPDQVVVKLLFEQSGGGKKR